MAKPGNPRMERGKGGRERGGREGEREREAGTEGEARAKLGNQLVIYKDSLKHSVGPTPVGNAVQLCL